MTGWAGLSRTVVGSNSAIFLPSGRDHDRDAAPPAEVLLCVAATTTQSLVIPSACTDPRPGQGGWHGACSMTRKAKHLRRRGLRRTTGTALISSLPTRGAALGPPHFSALGLP